MKYFTRIILAYFTYVITLSVSEAIVKNIGKFMWLISRWEITLPQPNKTQQFYCTYCKTALSCVTTKQTRYIMHNRWFWETTFSYTMCPIEFCGALSCDDYIFISSYTTYPRLLHFSGAIVWLFQCQGSNPDTDKMGYISRCYITIKQSTCRWRAVGIRLCHIVMQYGARHVDQHWFRDKTSFESMPTHCLDTLQNNGH